MFTPKGTSLREPTSFEPFCVKIGRRVWPPGRFGKKNPESHRGSHRRDMSPLTQGLNYRSACDKHDTVFSVRDRCCCLLLWLYLMQFGSSWIMLFILSISGTCIPISRSMIMELMMVTQCIRSHLFCFFKNNFCNIWMNAVTNGAAHRHTAAPISALGLHSIARRNELISRPAEGRRLSWHEHTVG